jgi:ubiquitin C-terminal hydrolase
MENNSINYGNSKYKNINGNTCYMNSTLAILQNTNLFADYIIKGFFSKDLINNIYNKLENNEKYNDLPEEEYKIQVYIQLINKLSYQLYQLFLASLQNDDCSITPTSFKSTIGKINPMWNENMHQDSQEFFSFLITNLEEEIGRNISFIPGRYFKKNLNKLSIKNNLLRIKAQKSWECFLQNEYSALKIIFNGLLYNRHICEFCNNVSNSFETFTTLQISIPKINVLDNNKIYNLYECLDHMVKEELLDYQNRMKCGLCYRKNKANKKMMIWKPPKILVFHIKRFEMNNYGIPVRKITNKVDYPIINLDIKDYIYPESPFLNKSKYNLFGINLHQEFGFWGNINSGHYTSIVKNRYDNKWYLYNDNNNIIKINNINQLKNKNAYLLFYLRTN